MHVQHLVQSIPTTALHTCRFQAPVSTYGVARREDAVAVTATAAAVVVIVVFFAVAVAAAAAASLAVGIGLGQH